MKILIRLLPLHEYLMVIKPSNMGQAVHVARVKELNVYNILVRKPERKRSLGRSRSRWEDNIERV